MSEVKSLAVRGRELREYVETRASTIAKLLPKGIDPARFVHVGLLATNQNPALLECTPKSFYLALLNCAHLGIMPDGVHGWAYIVPFRDRGKQVATLIVGYRGYIHLAYEGGGVRAIDARAVYQGDEFDFAFGTSPYIRHRPLAEPDPAKLTHAYARAELSTGGTVFEVLTRAQVDATRARSRARDGLGWTQFYEQMAVKTAVRRLVRWLPFVSPRLARAVELEEADEIGRRQGPPDLDPTLGIEIDAEEREPGDDPIGE